MDAITTTIERPASEADARTPEGWTEIEGGSKAEAAAKAEAESAIARALAAVASDKAEGASKPEAEQVPAIAYVSLPTRTLRAALLCAATDDARYHLRGVYLHCDGRDVRICATDGRVMFVACHRPENGELADILQDGVIVPAEGLKARLALIEGESQAEVPVVRVGYASGASHVELRDTLDSMRFRMAPVDGTFPEYLRIIEQAAEVIGGREMEAGEAVTFAPAIVRTASVIASVLKSSGIALYSAPAVPAVATFAGVPGAALVLMPLAGGNPLCEATVRVLAPAMKGTLAAIKANLTRTEAKLATCKDKSERGRMEAKIADYKVRIMQIEGGLSETGVAALPAPEAPAEVKAPATKAEASKSKARNTRKPKADKADKAE